MPSWGQRSDLGELFTDLLRSANAVLFRLDRTGVITAAEGKGLEAAGAGDASGEPRPWIGRSMFEVFATSPTVLDGVKRALLGEAVSSTTKAWDRSWDAHYAPVGDGAGPTAVAVLWMDCTARERAIVEAQRELRFVDSVLENVPNMIFVKDATDLRFVRFNKAGEELLGHPRAELLGKNDYDLFPASEADFFTAKDRAVLASGQLLDIPVEPIETRAHGRRYLRTKKIPIRDERGEPLYLVGISEDISDWRALDEERRKVLDSLLDLDRMKAQLIANVSHELRTPLTVILLLTERLMRDGEERPGRLKDLTEIERSARSLLSLVKDLLDASKLEAGRLRAEYANVDLARLVRLTAGSLESMARSIPVSFLIETPPTLQAQVDPDRVQHILSNLLSNAFKHTPPGGVVRCTVEETPELARITVADSGPGVPLELRDRVFERFFQVQGDPQRAGGTGLGLAIVKEFTELQHGRVSLDTAPEGGARFVVELPLLAPADAIVRTAELPAELASARQFVSAHAEPPPPAAHPGPDDRPRVLLAEDHPEMRRLLIDALEARYRVTATVDGRDALDEALADPPDLIVTDVMMPRMTGDELVRAVREQSSLDGVSIIVLTARDDDALRVELLRGGAQDFVTKPFSSEELLARIDNLVAIKRTRDVLQRELESGRGDIEHLARDLAARGRELRVAYDDASLARRRAESSNQVKSEFLELVSHELRSPMTTLRLRLDLLRRAKDEALTPRQEALVTRMTTAAERLYGIAQSLVDLVSVDPGSATAAPVDVAALTSSVLDAFRPQAVEKGLSLRLEIADGLPLLETDAHLVRVILMNLVGNAVKFTDRGEIRVAVSQASGAHRIEVRDTGQGIPEASRNRIFEPFQHLEALSHKHTPGTGVGLAIVRRAVDALGGHVEIDSRVGEGTAFVVTIPSLGAPR